MKIEFQLRDIVRSESWPEGGYCRIIEIRDRYVKLESLIDGNTRLCHKASVMPDMETVEKAERL